MSGTNLEAKEEAEKKSVVDKDWAKGVLEKLGAKSEVTVFESESEVTLFESKSEVTVPEKRDQAGYRWHKAMLPDKSLVGCRFKTDTDGVIIVCDVAGRPSGKHGGHQGQHTTAFATNKEAIIAATIGRTEDVARADLALLFATLLKYPAFTSDQQPEPDQELLKLIKAMADAGSESAKSYQIHEIATLYLEIRDALPGASLDTGVTSKSGNGKRENTGGKGEGTTLTSLRGCELALLQNPKDESVDQDGLVETMLLLYDQTSEESLGEGDIAAQHTTFVMTIAQAFPAAFQLVGAGLANKLKVESKYVDDLQEVCARLVYNNTGKSRPCPKDFVAVIRGDRIDVRGRSESLKDGGTMGDHTCAEQLMKNAATKLLMTKGKDTTLGDLLTGLKTIRTQFDPKKYEFFGGLGKDMSSLMHTHRLRQQELQKHHAELDKMIARLSFIEVKPEGNEEGEIKGKQKPVDANTDEKAREQDLIEAAELYMQLVDDRPTAVSYGAPAAGRGEGTTLTTLQKWEGAAVLGDELQVSAGEILTTALNLLDATSVSLLMDNVGEAAKELEENSNKSSDPSDVCLSLIADEFLFFFKHAYPGCHKLIKADLSDTSELIKTDLSDILRCKVRNYLTENAGLDKDDSEFTLEESVKSDSEDAIDSDLEDEKISEVKEENESTVESNGVLQCEKNAIVLNQLNKRPFEAVDNRKKKKQKY